MNNSLGINLEVYESNGENIKFSKVGKKQFPPTNEINSLSLYYNELSEISRAGLIRDDS